MMKKLLFTALAALTAAGLSAAERLEIPPRFQAQPATSANQPPKADAWSTNRGIIRLWRRFVKGNI